MSWTRHYAPLDRRSPVRAVRFSSGTTHIRATSDGVHLVGDLPTLIDPQAARELADVLSAASTIADALSKGLPIRRSR
jgi:hypothetical protein